MKLLNFSPVEIKRKIECDKKSRDKDAGNEISKRSTSRGEKRVNRICSGRDCEERKRTARDGGWNFAQPRNSSFRAQRTIPHVCTRVSENSAAKMPRKNVVVRGGRACQFSACHWPLRSRQVYALLANFAVATLGRDNRREKGRKLISFVYLNRRIFHLFNRILLYRQISCYNYK